MVKKLKQTISEKFLLIFVIIVTIVFFGSFITMKNKCLFVKNYDPKKINFRMKSGKISIIQNSNMLNVQLAQIN